MKFTFSLLVFILCLLGSNGCSAATLAFKRRNQQVSTIAQGNVAPAPMTREPANTATANPSTRHPTLFLVDAENAIEGFRTWPPVEMSDFHFLNGHKLINRGFEILNLLRLANLVRRLHFDIWGEELVDDVEYPESCHAFLHQLVREKALDPVQDNIYDIQKEQACIRQIRYSIKGQLEVEMTYVEIITRIMYGKHGGVFHTSDGSQHSFDELQPVNLKWNFLEEALFDPKKFENTEMAVILSGVKKISLDYYDGVNQIPFGYIPATKPDGSNLPLASVGYNANQILVSFHLYVSKHANSFTEVAKTLEFPLKDQVLLRYVIENESLRRGDVDSESSYEFFEKVNVDNYVYSFQELMALFGNLFRGYEIVFGNNVPGIIEDTSIN